MNPSNSLQARVLVIDDEESVRDSFLAVLCPGARAGAEVDAAAAALFGEPEPVAPTRGALIRFEVDCASHGKQGLALVEKALAEARPYAMIFCDMRMPGWDGVETVEHIRRIDQRAEVVFVTAYSDHSLESIAQEVGANVGYHVKPFATDELKQMATKGVLDWNRARELEALMATLTSIRGEANDINRLLSHLLQQICLWLGTESAALGQIGSGVHFRTGVGELADPRAAQPYLDSAVAGPSAAPNGATVLPIWQYGVVIALQRGPKITPDRLHLLRVFLEHASVAIKNVEMQAQLAEAQRMSAVGQAIGFIVHDLRGPLATMGQFMTMLRANDQSYFTREEMLALSERLLHQATGLVEDTLSYCRGEVRIAPREVELARAIEDSIRVARLDLEARRIALITRIPEGLTVFVDEPRLNRVFNNLLNNASDSIVDRPDARIEVDAEATAEGILIHVTDNGPGLPAEVRQKLFQPFASVGKSSGTGFGLAIVQQIMKAHHGRVSVESSAGRTRFSLFFPARQVERSGAIAV